MKKNIIILTAGVGNGHKTAAFGIKKKLNNTQNINSIEIIDITKEYFIGKIIKFIFDNSSFWFLEKIYTITNKPKFSWFDTFFINMCFYNLNKKINNKNNIEIYITFPMLQLLHVCYEKNIKTIIQVTDFYTPHFSWAWNNENISEIRVLDAHSKKYLLNNINTIINKNKHKIIISKFPLVLNKKKSINRADRKNIENIENKTILCFFHNVLLGNEEEIIQKIQRVKKYKQYKIIILAGRNYTKIKKFCSVKNNNNCEVLGWIHSSKMTTYYNNAEIVAGKCGGAFIAEVVKLQKKIIITGVFSVQEEGNFEYIKKYHSDLIIEI